MTPWVWQTIQMTFENPFLPPVRRYLQIAGLRKNETKKKKEGGAWRPDFYHVNIKKLTRGSAPKKGSPQTHNDRDGGPNAHKNHLGDIWIPLFVSHSTMAAQNDALGMANSGPSTPKNDPDDI